MADQTWYRGPFGRRCLLDDLRKGAIDGWMACGVLGGALFVLWMLALFAGMRLSDTFVWLFSLWAKAVLVGLLLAVLTYRKRPSITKSVNGASGTVVSTIELVSDWCDCVKCLPEQQILPDYKALADQEVQLSLPTRCGNRWSMAVGDHVVSGTSDQVGVMANWLHRYNIVRNLAIARAVSWMRESGYTVAHGPSGYSFRSHVTCLETRVVSSDINNIREWRAVVAARELELREIAAREDERAATEATQRAIMRTAEVCLTIPDEALSLVDSDTVRLTDAALSDAKSRLTGSFAPVDERLDA